METPEELYQQFIQSSTLEEAEKKEAESLIERGFYFEVGKRKFHIRPLCFGTITYANRYAVDLKVNLLSEDNASLFKEVDRNIDPLMMFISVCILHSKWKIKLFSGLLAKYLKWKLNPDKALKMSIAILQMYDIKNFITSISMIGQATITRPSPRESTLIDGKQPDSLQSTEQ